MVERSDTTLGFVFDVAVQALIVVSLISFALETLPSLSPAAQWVLRVVEVVTVAAFTVEYLLRLWVARHPWRFIFSFGGIVDLAAVLPFYLALGVDLRSVRVLRLFRLFRAFKLARYTRAVDRFRTALAEIRAELAVFAVATAAVLFLASVGIYYAEHGAQPDKYASVFHAMWWSLETLSTVGYGDVYPVTLFGRLFTGLILMLGLGIVAVPPALLASALTRTVRVPPQDNRPPSAHSTPSVGHD